MQRERTVGKDSTKMKSHVARASIRATRAARHIQYAPYEQSVWCASRADEEKFLNAREHCGSAER
jgi:hypothetical protein